jgi:hypothetical protein
MEFFIKLKYADASDPFRDPEDPLRPQANNFRFEKMNRMKLGLFVAHWPPTLLLTRGVSFAFTLSVYLCVCGKFARFVRLDRDGVIVTWRFDYIKDSRYLLLALRTCCLSPAGMQPVCLISYSGRYQTDPGCRTGFAR